MNCYFYFDLKDENFNSRIHYKDNIIYSTTTTQIRNYCRVFPYAHRQINTFTWLCTHQSLLVTRFILSFNLLITCYVGTHSLFFLSVVFHWLRHEKSGKRFSHTHLGVWVLVCGGGRGHMAYEISHFSCCRSPLKEKVNNQTHRAQDTNA